MRADKVIEVKVHTGCVRDPALAGFRLVQKKKWPPQLACSRVTRKITGKFNQRGNLAIRTGAVAHRPSRKDRERR